MNPKRKQNSSRVNLAISIIFHSLLIGTVFYFAAREGILGKKVRTIVATLERNVKKPEPPKPRNPEPKPEAPKAAEAPKTTAPAPKVETAATPPPAEGPAAVAPAAVILPAMSFTDGAREVETAADAKAAYKGMVERALRSRWNRPDDLADDTFVVEVELSVDPSGKLGGCRWLKGSGNARWDDSVKAALAGTKAISHGPPKGFPDHFLVRFDVEAAKTEEVISLTSR